MDCQTLDHFPRVRKSHPLVQFVWWCSQNLVSGPFFPLTGAAATGCVAIHCEGGLCLLFELYFPDCCFRSQFFHSLPRCPVSLQSHQRNRTLRNKPQPRNPCGSCHRIERRNPSASFALISTRPPPEDPRFARFFSAPTHRCIGVNPLQRTRAHDRHHGTPPKRKQHLPCLCARGDRSTEPPNLRRIGFGSYLRSVISDEG